MTPADILTKLKTVDGSASGLDADLLDGLNTSSTNTVSTVMTRDATGSTGVVNLTASGSATVTNDVTAGSFKTGTWTIKQNSTTKSLNFVLG